MRQVSNFHNGFSNGVAIRGMPLLNAYSGQIWWVHSGGQAHGAGSFNRPFTTIDEAVNHCEANDTIMVKAGHAETLTTATALVLDVAGISIIGLGQGAKRPTLTLGTAATTKVPVSASSISIENIAFVANFADITTVFLLTTAPDFSVENCEFKDTSSILNFLTIITTTVSVVADGLRFVGNDVMGLATTAATTPIKVAGTHDRLTISDNYIKLAILNNTSAVLAHGALVVTNLRMERNRVFRLNTDTATGGILVTTTSTTNTGVICDNYVKCADAAGIILATAGSIYGMFNNLVSGAADTSGFVLPAIDTDS